MVSKLYEAIKAKLLGIDPMLFSLVPKFLPKLFSLVPKFRPKDN